MKSDYLYLTNILVLLNYHIASFFIPYVLAMLVAILPASYLEMLMGQMARKGAIQSWNKLIPIWKGIL